MSKDNPTAQKLSPFLSPFAAWTMSIGTSIGWGSMFVMGNTYLPQAGPLGSIIGLIIGALIMLVISRNYHYMLNAFPDEGGAYAYTKKSFSYDHGFLGSWFLLLTYIAILWANATALPLFAQYFLGDTFRFGFSYTVFGYKVYLGEALLSILAILIIALLCAKTKKISMAVLSVSVIIFTAGILLCFLSAIGSKPLSSQEYHPLFIPDNNLFAQILRIACISPWAYIGFENISHMAPEYSFPHRKTFRILTISVISSFLLYAAVTILSISAYPPEYDSWLAYIRDLPELNGIKGLPAFYAAEHFLGNTGIIILLLTMFALILTSLIGNMTALSRLLYAMAEDNIIPSYFASLNRNNIPDRTIWLIAALSILIPFLGRSAVGWIVDVTTIGATIIYGFVSASAWKLARSKGHKLEMFTGMSGLVIMIFFALYLLLFDLIISGSMEAESYFLFTVWSVFGFIIFSYILKKDIAKKFGRTTLVWIALLLLVLSTSLIWMNQSAMTSTRKSMENVRDYYTGQSASQVTDIQELLDIELNNLQQTNIKSMLVVVLVFAVSLAIHMLMQKKHTILEKEKTIAEEGSRAKSRFLFNMSHDIRTPMNAIIGFTHLAMQEGVSPEQKDAYLMKISSSGKQLLGIINDVLDMSRIESGKMELVNEPMDIRQPFKDIGDMFEIQMKEKNIDFSIDCSGLKHDWILCDKNRFARILLNLVSNACKFTGKGGTVAVTMKEVSSDGKNSSYELRVRDTGIGMSKEFLEHIFTPFEMERPSTISGVQGTGLGLSITKSIVDLMKGSITVTSEQNKGTEFVVKLSFTLTEQPVQDTPSDDMPELDYSQYHLLLVEDNEINIEIAGMILSQYGFSFECANDGKTALELVRQSQPGHFDAVLMDIQMPVMNGYDASRAIRALDNPSLASIPVIAMTANVFQEDIQAEHDAGMNAHITKPLDVDAMINTLTDILQQTKK